MKAHTTFLEKGSKKHICPNCGKKRFVRCINQINGGYMPDKFGRCDREADCGYTLYPSKSGLESTRSLNLRCRQESTIKTYIPLDIFKKSLSGYGKNQFLNNLLSTVDYPFMTEDIESVVSHFCLGTISNGYRTGALTLPFIDNLNNVCAVQVKEFNCSNHTISTDFLHSIIERHCLKKRIPVPDWITAYNKNDLKVSCLFNEHNLKKFPTNRIALVESPKTAIYGTLYFGLPTNAVNPLWLAVYNLSSINYQKCKCLKGRNITLYPDLSKSGKAYDMWAKKARELEAMMPGTKFNISNFLEINATIRQREKGEDLADFLIKLDWKNFRIPIQNINEKLINQVEETTLITKDLFDLETPKNSKTQSYLPKLYNPDPEKFDLLLYDLDNGCTWEIISKRDEWCMFDSITAIKAHFKLLLTKYIYSLSHTERQAFIKERYKNGHTKDGIHILFPGLKHF